jgi:hypothetical protein
VAFHDRDAGFTLLGSNPKWYSATVTFLIELQREKEGRWLAEIDALPGVVC